MVVAKTMHLSLLQNTKCLNFAHYECLPSVLFCTFPTFLVRGNLSALSGYQSFTRSENFLFPPENDPDFLFRILQEKSVLAKHCMLLFPFFSGSLRLYRRVRARADRAVHLCLQGSQSGQPGNAPDVPDSHLNADESHLNTKIAFPGQ